MRLHTHSLQFYFSKESKGKLPMFSVRTISLYAADCAEPLFSFISFKLFRVICWIDCILYNTPLCVCKTQEGHWLTTCQPVLWLTYWDRAVNHKSINVFSIYSLLIYIWNVLSVRRIRRGFCSTEIFCSCQLKNNFNPEKIDENKKIKT